MNGVHDTLQYLKNLLYNFLQFGVRRKIYTAMFQAYAMNKFVGFLSVTTKSFQIDKSILVCNKGSWSAKFASLIIIIFLAVQR